MNNGEQPFYTRTAAESLHQPPGDDIFPLQSPYGDIHGLTPPPEEFESFLKESVHYEQQLRSPFELTTNPPTPPRTEAVSSPSDSVGSDRSSSPNQLPTSSPTTNPSSPGSNAAEMDSEMDFGDLCADLVQQDNDGVLLTNGMHDIAAAQKMVEEMMGQELDDSQFFDFESAASSPKPAPSMVQAFSPRDQPAQFQSLFSTGQFQPHRTPQMAQRVLDVNRSHSRKRSRGDFDIMGDSAIQFDMPMSPPREVKTEGLVMQPEGFHMENGDFGFQPHQDIPNHSLNFTSTQVMHVAASRPMKMIHPDGSTFPTPYSLHIDFPKHMTRTATSNGMEFVVKSRVETQIGIRFAMTPVMGATRMRLPKHTIAKIKYLEDISEGPETVELSAMVVCASAMQSRQLLELACAEAAGVRLQDWVVAAKRDLIEKEHAVKAAQSDKEEGKQKVDYTKSQWGAPVSICEQCMNRERKRAGRKKNKKPDEEQKWAIDEKKRIIVFNTNQIRTFEPCQLGVNAGGVAGAGGILAETQMRICCYCRHHGEKDGFKVIFTIKDHNGVVLAQSITSTIVITDDHKTTAAGGTAAAIVSQHTSQENGIMMPVDSTRDTSPLAPPFGDGGRMDTIGSMAPEAAMSPNFNFGGSISPKPRTNGLSNPGTPARTSPSPAGPLSKRRKSSKVPANLAMTPSDPTQFGFTGVSSASYARNSSEMGSMVTQPQQQPQWASPLTPSARPVYRNDNGTNFDPFGNMAWSPTVENGNILDQLRSPAQIPPQSRSQQQPSFQINPFKFAKAISAPVDPDPEPSFGSGAVISRVVPGEGTCRGGIEVTVLGRNFVNGMTVVFGDNPAPDTYFYSESTLLCRLPPNPIPGAVAVYLKNRDREQSQPHSLTIFTYVDDVEKELMALALTVVGMKMKGTESGSSKQIALSILRDSGMSHEAVQARHGNGGGQQLEASLLACLDMIDMDDSHHPAKLNHKNKSGQTMLHLACMLGFQKFAAALLARGVNVNTRDKGGYTPLHFAAQYNRTDVIRKLLINRANAGIRTRNGDTAADLGQSNQIVRTTRSVQQAHSRQHSRSSSASSEHRFGSRRSSLGSIGTSLPPTLRASIDDYYHDSSDDESPDSDDTLDSSEEDLVDRLRSASRRGSIKDLTKLAVPSVDQAAAISAVIEAKSMDLVGSTVAANTEPTPSNPAIMAAAWMEAWREQLAQSFQNLHLNIPTIPAIPAIPTAADYQTIFQNHMARFQNPMAKWKPTVQRDDPTQDYKWSELFNPPPPPAYDELFPESSATHTNDPKTAASEAVPEASSTAMERRPTLHRTPSPTIDLKELHRRIASGDPAMSETLQAEYIAHIRKMKRIESDRRLFFVWIPILILILVLMAFSSGPGAFVAGKAIAGFVGQLVTEPAVVRQRVGTWLVGGAAGAMAPVNVGGN